MTGKRNQKTGQPTVRQRESLHYGTRCRSENRSRRNNPEWLTGTLSEGVNVRRDDAEPDVWRPAGYPSVIRRDSWMPLQRIVPDDAGYAVTFMRNGNILGAATAPAGTTDDDGLSGKVTEISQLTGTPLHFHTAGPGIVRILMKHEAPVYLGYRKNAIQPDADSGPFSFTLHGPMLPLPPLWLTATDETLLSEPLPDIRLSGEGISRGTLTATDLQTAGHALTAAYDRLRKKALRLGFFMQPVIARYRLLDATGDTLAVSPPVLACTASGFQCCGGIATEYNGSSATLSGGAIQCRVYRLEARTGKALPEPWKSMVKSAVIETLAPLDPVDSSDTCSASVSGTGSNPTVTFHLPGIAPDSTARNTRLQGLTATALASSHGKWLTQGVFQQPFAATGNHTTISPDTHAVPADNDPTFLRRDDVSYGACAECDDNLLLADERTEDFNGYPLENYASERGSGTHAWQAVIRVRIDAGNGMTRTAVSTTYGQGEAPTALSPLLVFPDADATEMTIGISGADGSSTVTGTYRLTPLREAGIAFHISPTLERLRPCASSDSLPPATPDARHAVIRHGMITLCDKLRLSAPLMHERCATGAIHSIHEAPRSRGIWDFARKKLILAGESGITVMTLDNSHRLRSSALLDPRPVKSHEAVCLCAGEQGTELAAIAGGDLVGIGAGGVTTIMRGCKAVQPGWSTSHGELWLLFTDGTLRRMLHPHLNIRETTAIHPYGTATGFSMLQWGHRLLIESAGTLMDASREEFPEEGISMLVRLRHDRLRAATATLRNIIMHVHATKFAGKLSLYGDNGSARPQLLTRLTAEGQLNAPVAWRVVMPGRIWLETEINATTGKDAEWRGVEINRDFVYLHP